ncbi:hypothetical protein B0J17DRAFT_632867 [Rhizoctonia solani]|nr:hypothetical protein B0J17DRAFT_632867 [Rhizoctonia solani]
MIQGLIPKGLRGQVELATKNGFAKLYMSMVTWLVLNRRERVTFHSLAHHGFTRVFRVSIRKEILTTYASTLIPVATGETTKQLQDRETRTETFWKIYDIIVGCDWTLGNAHIEWIDVIGFDNFVVKSYDRIKTPANYLKTVDLCPPRFDVTHAQQQYDKIQPLVMTLSEWSIPT